MVGPLLQQGVYGSVMELMDLAQHMACSGVQVAGTVREGVFGLGLGRMLEPCSVGVSHRPKVTP